MSKILQIKIFNDILDQFLEYLEENFEFFKSDIILSRTAVEFVRKSNPRMVVEQFMSYAYPYRKEVFECNEDFFVNFDVNVKDLSSEDVMFGMRIRSIWLSSDITDNQKAHIWLYFQKLIKAGEKVII
jgi:hypothetical protein